LGQKKQDIEKCFNLHSANLVNQAAGCLSLMKVEFYKNKIDDARDYGDLTKETLEFANWSEPIQKKFTAAQVVMCEWRNYFLSYTNRNADSINLDYQNLITRAWGRWPKNTDREGANYVARTIAKYLRENNLAGFFDPIDIKCGDDIEDEVLNYCQNCASLIQLVEKCSFSMPEPEKKNWCHREYEIFINTPHMPELEIIQEKRRHFSITTESSVDKLKPAVPIYAYESWLEATRRCHIDSLEGKTAQQLRSIVTDIASSVYQNHKQLAEDMVGALYEQSD
jgi:hypothetical protein